MTRLDPLPASLPGLLDLPPAEQFPGLRAGVARFDAPGGTLVHRAVIEAMSAYLGSEHVANDGGPFAASRYSDALVTWAGGRVRALLGARGGHIVFGANMTTLTTMFLRSLADGIGEGDEIVCTELDHEANVVPWRALASRRGARVRTARLAEDGTLPAASVIEQIGPRTRWVAVTAASNAFGSVPDLASIVAAAHAAGARVYVDGVQAVAHRPVDIAALGCDAFVTAPYKWYGPHCGVLWIAEETAAGLGLPEQTPSAGASPPGHLQLGTTNFEAVLGTGTAAEVLMRWDGESVAKRERRLTEELLSSLRSIPGIRVLGPGTSGDRVPVVTFQLDGHSAESVATRLAQSDIAVSHGSFYASEALRALSPHDPRAVRAGIACYSTEDDVQMLVTAVDAIARNRQ